MNLRNFIATATLLLCSTGGALAVPAYTGIIKVKQADGTELSIRIHGDERANFITTDDGYPILLNQTTGNYEYAKLANGSLRASGIVATNATMRTKLDKEFLEGCNKTATIDAALTHRKAASALATTAAPRKANAKPMKTLVNNFPHMGEQHSIVILMEFNDKQFSTMDNPQQYYTDAMNKEGFTAENGANGSARDFFIASSNGMFSPTFDVYGPVKIDYAQHDAGQGTYHTPINMGTFVQAAIEGLDDVVDFSQYDHDGDGYVDNVYIYYAGNGSADSKDANTIWPHAFDMRSWCIDLKTNDGVKIGSYTCSNEVDGTRSGNLTTGIGTFVHEFGHCLGFADHYDTNNPTANYTPGDWDTMASGSYNNNSNTPPLYSSYERYEMGWITPEDITHRTDAINSLPNLGDSNKAYKISVPGKDNEYFLLENRQLKGWDAYLPGEGMLVWHIDDNRKVWQKNEVNNTPTHQHVDIVEANGKPSGHQYFQNGVPFPGANNVTQHQFKSWEDKDLLTIDNITMADGIVSFIVAGADAGITKPSMTINDISYNGFNIAWDKVENADRYILDIKKIEKDNSTTEIDGYTDLEISSLSHTVTGLDESATYMVSLSSCAGSFYSEANTKTVETPAMPFAAKQVANVRITDATSSSLSATWDELDGAQGYLVTLASRAYDGDEQTTAYDFADRKEGMPAGWQTNSSSFISSEGYYGEAAPALRLSADGNYLIANNGDAMTKKLSFWYYVGKPAEGSTINVQTMRDGEWTTEKTIDASTQKKEVASIEFEPTTAVKIQFKRTNASNMVIDDVSLSGNGIKNHPLERYNMKSVDNVATYTFDQLEASTDYSLTVYAICNGEKTRPSAEIVATTTDNTADSITAIGNTTTADHKIYDLSGRQINGIPTNGIYIKNVNGKRIKVAK